ncbi:MAG TPA: hypothetical protein VGW35_13310 [Methylomirabilota bacterium]|nr:hypothetical protein [Methylomirabilota bacterium]
MAVRHPPGCRRKDTLASRADDRPRAGRREGSCTSSAEHMKQDLASRDLALSADEVRAIESLAG